jgi:predicted peroxiredoxin
LSGKKLGILVNTDKNLKHFLGICRAAKDAGVEVSLFIMDDGCFLTQKEEFTELCKEEGITAVMCDHSYKEKGFTEELAEVKHGSQFDHALIANECDRYIVL